MTMLVTLWMSLGTCSGFHSGLQGTMSPVMRPGYRRCVTAGKSSVHHPFAMRPQLFRAIINILHPRGKPSWPLGLPQYRLCLAHGDHALMDYGNIRFE